MVIVERRKLDLLSACNQNKVIMTPTSHQEYHQRGHEVEMSELQTFQMSFEDYLWRYFLVQRWWESGQMATQAGSKTAVYHGVWAPARVKRTLDANRNVSKHTGHVGALESGTC
jgi:hypothetical protein